MALPRLYWECGLIGQMLYLEAEALGLRGTGIGCFFDDAVHQLVGQQGPALADLYHFTVGGAVEDPRLTTLPAYPAEPEEPRVRSTATTPKRPRAASCPSRRTWPASTNSRAAVCGATGVNMTAARPAFAFRACANRKRRGAARATSGPTPSSR